MAPRPRLLFFVLALLLARPSSGGPARPGALRDAVRTYVRDHQVPILREFAALLALPNVSSDRPNLLRNAEEIMAGLHARGVSGRLLDGEGGPPVVFGELKVPGARKTLAVYAHYDGQPVDPREWADEPFRPVLRNRPLEDGGREVDLASLRGPAEGEWRLYARGSGDDKAPIIGFLAALDALAASGIPASVNVKFLFEGEEEAGSPHLRAVLERNRDLLRADGWFLCDGPVHQTRRMQVYFGARGITDAEITLYGPIRPVHSGHYGNWAGNPALALAHLLAGLRDLDGRILIPGFYDDVREPTERERQALMEVPDVDAALRHELALAETEGHGARLAERLMLPALNVRGLESGHVGARAANAVPAEATASLDFRLVPDQKPLRVQERFEAHLRSQGYVVVPETPSLEARRLKPRLLRLRWGSGYPSYRASLDLPFSRAVVGVIEEERGGPIVKMLTLGGSIPMYLFPEVLGAPVVGVPIANHDDNQHAANENLRLENLWDGIEVYASLLARLGEVWAE
jgi:acetylornithine deacetylase/succinyl-diaminopimelate desuccinylase-like protein